MQPSLARDAHITGTDVTNLGGIKQRTAELWSKFTGGDGHE